MIEPKYLSDYKELIPKYEDLGKNVIQALNLILAKEGIKTISIIYRVKGINSLKDKVERKGYKNPLEEIEDLCGIRIICLYKKDINRISELIQGNFNIFETNNKENGLKDNQFGYRSLHHIASIKKDWEKVPNYKGLKDLKFEIQIRTTLMHAWAEIEHELSYKNKKQIPKEFRRKLSLLSGKLEEADEQFEEIKEKSLKLQKELSMGVEGMNTESINTLEELQVFLDYYFPDREKKLNATSEFLEDIINYNLDLQLIDRFMNKYKEKIIDFERDIGHFPMYFAQVGIARMILRFYDKNYKRKYSHNLIEKDSLKKNRLNKKILEKYNLSN